MLWERIRNRKIGPKFRRQVPIGFYVLDFFCPREKLVVEVDGHWTHERFLHDAARTAWLESHGCRVIRFEATEVMVHLDDVVEQRWLMVNHD
jgi:very-short-patch-repair endonuclease